MNYKNIFKKLQIQLKKNKINFFQNIKLKKIQSLFFKSFYI